MQRRIMQSSGTDVYQHLAVEEFLLNTLEPDTCILYLWQSDHAVVIGKNQNPWLECSLPAVDRRQVRLARRLSGGGAVYQDRGNLNFTFVLWQEDYDKQALSGIVVDAVRSLGIEAAIGDRHVLQADGRKFSGNAFAIRRKKVIHHGTLLIDADLAALQEVLRPTCAGIETKGIRSVPAPVVNLKELQEDLAVADVVGAVVRAFRGSGAAAELDLPEVGELRAVYASDAWRFGRTPRFTVRGNVRDGDREVELEAVIVKSMVDTASVWPADSELADACLGLPFAQLLKRYPELVVQ